MAKQFLPSANSSCSHIFTLTSFFLGRLSSSVQVIIFIGLILTKQHIEVIPPLIYYFQFSLKQCFRLCYWENTPFLVLVIDAIHYWKQGIQNWLLPDGRLLSLVSREVYFLLRQQFREDKGEHRFKAIDIKLDVEELVPFNSTFRLKARSLFRTIPGKSGVTDGKKGWQCGVDDWPDWMTGLRHEAYLFDRLPNLQTNLSGFESRGTPIASCSQWLFLTYIEI